jgi:hypothetical protein
MVISRERKNVSFLWNISGLFFFKIIIIVLLCACRCFIIYLSCTVFLRWNTSFWISDIRLGILHREIRWKYSENYHYSSSFTTGKTILSFFHHCLRFNHILFVNWVKPNVMWKLVINRPFAHSWHYSKIICVYTFFIGAISMARWVSSWIT